MDKLILLLAGLAVSFFFSGVEIGAYSVNRLRLLFRSSIGAPGAHTLQAVLADREMIVSTCLVGTNLGNYLAAACATSLLAQAAVARPQLWGTLILSPILLASAELLPKVLFTTHANALMYRLAFTVRIFEALLWPLSVVLKAVMVTFDSILGRAEPEGLGKLSQPRLRRFIAEVRHEGAISPEQDRMARNVMELERITLRNVMVPLGRMAVLSLDAAPEQVTRLARRHTYSRFPVYSRHRGNIVGILGLVEYLSQGEGRPPADFVRPGLRMNESDPIDAALLRLRRAREAMGLVVGKRGKVVGVVTLKDLVEEIVGELSAW